LRELAHRRLNLFTQSAFDSQAVCCAAHQGSQPSQFGQPS
jgi:hypothetical protein